MGAPSSRARGVSGLILPPSARQTPSPRDRPRRAAQPGAGGRCLYRPLSSACTTAGGGVKDGAKERAGPCQPPRKLCPSMGTRWPEAHESPGWAALTCRAIPERGQLFLSPAPCGVPAPQEDRPPPWGSKPGSRLSPLLYRKRWVLLGNPQLPPTARGGHMRPDPPGPQLPLPPRTQAHGPHPGLPWSSAGRRRPCAALTCPCVHLADSSSHPSSSIKASSWNRVPLPPTSHGRAGGRIHFARRP